VTASNAFPCTGCGACCQVAGAIQGFSEPSLPDGRCAHLTTANRCAVYRTRPIECRIQPGTHLENAKACNQLQDWFLQSRERRYVNLALVHDHD
jgi:Fe-S-cluster containining protein